MLVKHVHNRLFLVSFDATVVTLLELHTKKFRQGPSAYVLSYQ